MGMGIFSQKSQVQRTLGLEAASVAWAVTAGGALEPRDARESLVSKRVFLFLFFFIFSLEGYSRI